jgi:hypothetical protein
MNRTIALILLSLLILTACTLPDPETETGPDLTEATESVSGEGPTPEVEPTLDSTPASRLDDKGARDAMYALLIGDKTAGQQALDEILAAHDVRFIAVFI